MIERPVRVGDKFYCAVCGREDFVRMTHAEMVATYETIYGREYVASEAFLVCDNCMSLILGRKPCGKPPSPPSPSSGGGASPTGSSSPGSPSG